MSALNVASLFPELGVLTPMALDRWVAAALAQADALHQHDSRLYPADSSQLQSAERLRDAWRAWTEDAELLLSKTSDCGQPNAVLPRLERLTDEVARAHLLFDLRPEIILERRQKALHGDRFTIEEVRRELQSGHRG